MIMRCSSASHNKRMKKMHTMFSEKQLYFTRDIELIIKYRVIWKPSVPTV